MKTYRVAIVGLGRMGSTIDDEVQDSGSVTLPYSIASSCRASDRLELVAGSDLLPEKRDAFRERWGVTALYEDYLEMVEIEQPDMVAVCTTATGLQKPGKRAPSTDFRDSTSPRSTVTSSTGRRICPPQTEKLSFTIPLHPPTGWTADDVVAH